MILTPDIHNIFTIKSHILKTENMDGWNPSGGTGWIIAPLLEKIHDNESLIPDEIRNNVSLFQRGKNTSAVFLIFANEGQYNTYFDAYQILWKHRDKLGIHALPTELIMSFEFPDGLKGLSISVPPEYAVSDYSDAYLRYGVIVDPIGFLVSDSGKVIREIGQVSEQTTSVLFPPNITPVIPPK